MVVVTRFLKVKIMELKVLWLKMKVKYEGVMMEEMVDKGVKYEILSRIRRPGS